MTWGVRINQIAAGAPTNEHNSRQQQQRGSSAPPADRLIDVYPPVQSQSTKRMAKQGSRISMTVVGMCEVRVRLDSVSVSVVGHQNLHNTKNAARRDARTRCAGFCLRWPLVKAPPNNTK
mmetsp:Transcript_13835/g.39760  ORF Transcript_13835/g.39760 Transcript_13835/m.39760 type:complete len:120 (+) Transcript_13835:117-476(+)